MLLDHTHTDTDILLVSVFILWSCEVNTAKAAVRGHKSDRQLCKEKKGGLESVYISPQAQRGVAWPSSSILKDASAQNAPLTGNCSDGKQILCLGGQSESMCVCLWTLGL